MNADQDLSKKMVSSARETTGDPLNAKTSSETRKKSKLRGVCGVDTMGTDDCTFHKNLCGAGLRHTFGFMEDTLMIGDHIFVNKFIYGIKIPFTDTRILSLRDPKRGDVIVFKYPVDRSKDFIKRVIGVPGDEIVIRNKQVFVNVVKKSEILGLAFIKYWSWDKDTWRIHWGEIGKPIH